MKKMVDGIEVDMTQEEIDEFNQREADHRAALAAAALVEYRALRQRAYPSIDEAVVALLESIVENRPESLQALAAERAAVKALYPKPEEG